MKPLSRKTRVGSGPKPMLLVATARLLNSRQWFDSVTSSAPLSSNPGGTRWLAENKSQRINLLRSGFGELNLPPSSEALFAARKGSGRHSQPDPDRNTLGRQDRINRSAHTLGGFL